MRKAGEGRSGTADERRLNGPRSGPRDRTFEDHRAEAVGPQGAALILELRRIQRAFDQEQDAGPRWEYAGRRPYDGLRVVERGEDHGPAIAGKRKGMMRRAVENCVRRFAIGIAPLAYRRPEAARQVRPAPASPPPRDRQRVDRVLPPRERPPESSSPNVVASIDLLRRLARDAERQLASGEGGKDVVAERPDQRIPAALLAVGGRAGTTLISGAKAGYRYLLGADSRAADASDAALATRIGRSFEEELRSGLRMLILGLGVGGAWATFVPLSAAVVVTGSLVVESSTKKVQHPSGGIVAQIPVHDGMHVNAGDLVLRLDETQARASLQVITSQLDEVVVRIARLVAERDGLDEPRMPPALAGRSGDQGLDARFASETSLFRARATSRQNQKELLQSRVAQLEEQIGGLEAQMKSNASQLELIARELEGVRSLYEQRLAPITRLNALQRDSARLEGERGQLQSAIAETKSKIGEARLQMIRIDRDFRADVIKDLREAEGRAAELAERRVAAQDQLTRIDILAPTAGVIHQLAVHTVGGVIKAGDVAMEIVPDADELQVEARLPPKDIDQVKVGQTTLVRFSAFDQRTTPQLSGFVSYVSADSSREQQGDTSYYTVRVTLPEEEHRRLTGLRLVSGMPAEIFVQSGSRTMASYLLKPITDQLRRAFNER
jgi:membrane fusion protein, type I secretion system